MPLELTSKSELYQDVSMCYNMTAKSFLIILLKNNKQLNILNIFELMIFVIYGVKPTCINYKTS